MTWKRWNFKKRVSWKQNKNIVSIDGIDDSIFDSSLKVKGAIQVETFWSHFEQESTFESFFGIVIWYFFVYSENLKSSQFSFDNQVSWIVDWSRNSSFLKNRYKISFSLPNLTRLESEFSREKLNPWHLEIIELLISKLINFDWDIHRKIYSLTWSCATR